MVLCDIKFTLMSQVLVYISDAGLSWNVAVVELYFKKIE